jgi:ABC-type branched-subunit amino acid transport system permease subunit
MVAALGGAFYGALQQAITPLDFLWSTSLTLLLLVVLGGRSVISGAVIAGAVFGLEKMISNPQFNEYFPLAIALGVIALAQEPEGTVALARRETLRVLSVLRPLPRRSRGRGSPIPSGAEVAVAAGGPSGGSGHGL